jgi:hypothetical protein
MQTIKLRNSITHKGRVWFGTVSASDDTAAFLKKRDKEITEQVAASRRKTAQAPQEGEPEPGEPLPGTPFFINENGTPLDLMGEPEEGEGEPEEGGGNEVTFTRRTNPDGTPVDILGGLMGGQESEGEGTGKPKKGKNTGNPGTN